MYIQIYGNKAVEIFIVRLDFCFGVDVVEFLKLIVDRRSVR